MLEACTSAPSRPSYRIDATNGPMHCPAAYLHVGVQFLLVARFGRLYGQVRRRHVDLVLFGALIRLRRLRVVLRLLLVLRLPRRRFRRRGRSGCRQLVGLPAGDVVPVGFAGQLLAQRQTVAVGRWPEPVVVIVARAVGLAIAVRVVLTVVHEALRSTHAQHDAKDGENQQQIP